MVDLSVNLFGRKLKNPLFLPAGIITEIKNHSLAIQAGAGLVVLKSITLLKREGNPHPRLAKFSCGYVNSVGLTNPGIKEGKKQIEEFIRQFSVPIVVSIFGTSIEEFKKIANQLIEIKIFAIELNLSCPNVKNRFGKIFSENIKSSYQVVKEVKKIIGETPLIAKLSPNFNQIGELAKACQEAGAQAICAINTISPAMLIDINKKKPILGNKIGGMSGPAIKPVAIAKIYEIYKKVKIPILGVGGVETWQDAIEMFLAGASLVGVGSSVYRQGWGVYQKILTGIKNYLKKEKIKTIKSLVGQAHKN